MLLLGRWVPATPLHALRQGNLSLSNPVHTPLLWEAFLGKPHPALSTTYPKSPQRLDPELPYIPVPLFIRWFANVLIKPHLPWSSLVVRVPNVN